MQQRNQNTKKQMKKEEIQLMSMQELLDSGKLFWIKSLPTLRKWVKKDIHERNLLRAIVVKGEGKGIRYYFNPKYVEEYKQLFMKEQGDVYRGERLRHE